MLPKPTIHPRRVTERIWLWLSWVAVALVVAVMAIVAGIYVAGREDNLSRGVARMMGLPSITIGWRTSGLDTYLDQFQALEHYQRVQLRDAPGLIEAQSDSELRRTTLRKVIRDAALLSLVKRFNLEPSVHDIDQAFTAQVAQSGDSTAITKRITELYGWDTAFYKHYVIRIAVARERLRDYLNSTPPYNDAARLQAERVAALVASEPESFEDFAKRYSEDDYGANGGEVGFVQPGELDQALEQVAFQLDIGEVSAPVQSKYGFHILKVTDRRGTDDDPEIHLYQIFVGGPAVDEIIDAALKTERIYVWVPGYHWDQPRTDVIID